MRRMKSPFIITVLLLVTLTSAMVKPASTYAASVDVEAESAILVDSETGKVLFEKQADVALPPASMTKMMTEYLVLEAIEDGKIAWDTTTQISDYPYSISANTTFSGFGLKQSKDYTVEELYDAMAIFSDNAASIALAELIAGTEGEFVKLMNQKADEMGLGDASFVNSTGLNNTDLGDNYPEGTEPDGTTYMSAESVALLAYYLINDYPDALEISSQPTLTFEDRTADNWNWMLPDSSGQLQQYAYDGVDGLKTGYTDLAGYTFAGTAERGGQRYITVVMRTDSKGARFNETAKLLDYGFNQFQTTELFDKGYQKEDEATLPVAKGKKDEVQVATNEALEAVIKKGEKDQYNAVYEIDESILNEDGKVTAPISKGDKVGTMTVEYTGSDQYSYINDEAKESVTIDLVAQEDVEKSNWFVLMFQSIFGFFGDIFSSVVDTVKGWF
ncbi:D-alanyl-D-alanine carboxypeptidase [Pontibacillus halophilus JSM 076056 = DSM 19796]|uniref:serine-type D-Ala-D-Ala carboxypeptidase n=1 Tax=Pontibacillus halophilus JSM 076056 = DSM 19796 TaxID=1385510 RepID=A0A0A5GQZ6_9BACI|nr:serine hydrolase [Pontibacillus halophilus]KGX93663.1 D-alanyl-D-alanine carboxypeptidase [Pontibacillus halophilus JSM 076056 = DSM 19796]